MMNSERRDNWVNAAAEDGVTNTYMAVPSIGRIAGSDASGTILVDCGGSRPSAARLLSGMSRKELSKTEMRGCEVLVVFAGGDPGKPIIVGLLADPLEELLALEAGAQKPERPNDLIIDGERITIDAREEIVLKCGDGSITLRKDGKIVIRGTHLLSRASGPNRIKGGSVQIN